MNPTGIREDAGSIPGFDLHPSLQQRLILNPQSEARE